MKKKGYGYKQGKFYPVNREKYKGKYPIIYRSSWELSAFMSMDKNKAILKWGSESIVIQYYDVSRNNTVHRYFIDLNFTAKENNKLVTYWVEIKPYKECCSPKKGKKSDKTFLRESVTWLRNSSKWKAAVKVSKSKGVKFALWTEKGVTVLS